MQTLEAKGEHIHVRVHANTTLGSQHSITPSCPTFDISSSALQQVLQTKKKKVNLGPFQGCDVVLFCMVAGVCFFV